MKTLVVASKTLREILREPPLAVMLVLAPTIFLGALALGYGSPRLATHPVLVLDPQGQAGELLSELAALNHDDGRALFDLRPVVDTETADGILAAREADALLRFDGDELTVRGDAGNLRHVAAVRLLERAIVDRAMRESGRPRVAQLQQRSLMDDGPRTLFDLYAPGMLVFAILLIIPQTAFHVSRELRLGTLRRLRLTPMRSRHLLGGVALAQLAVAAVQVPVVFAVARLLGYHAVGSLALGIGVGLVLCVGSIGLGLCVSGLAQNDGQAVSLGAAVMIVQVVVCGAFFPLPPMTLFELGGHPIGPFDVLPATHGMLALQQVLSYGDGASEVAFRVGATLGLSLVYLVAGVAI
ncbi:MAG: ABC transporter permease, partial [Myxococcota bacterium]|nr:ABC transporter permease [Myxococcota bacterium]